ncbi:DUF1971 domain-containing protein [Endozoicomonas lisbonensis]|uniref:Tellurite resistance-related uncharacterized protein n=1 Tax=Endozoicomonas lisbonensis TaxID=3120522 RepID=A0ABV2SHU7_9GAMM
MRVLPDSVTPYKRTGLFTSDNVPDAFLKQHSTAKDKWGVLTVQKGSLIFCDDETQEKIKVAEPDSIVIKPSARHHLELEGYAEFYVEFYA